MKQFSKVRLITSKFESEGAKLYDVGYIVEAYPDGKFEVEFADSNTGIDYAMIVATADELEEIE